MDGLIAAAFDALPAAGPRPRAPLVAAPKLFSGEFHRSAYHTDAARRSRKERNRDVESDLEGLSSAWNANVLRSGDRTFAGEPNVKGEHVNRYLPDGILRIAFDSIGLAKGHDHGLAGCRHRLAIASTVAAAAERAEEHVVVDPLLACLTAKQTRCLVLCQHYDATPMQVQSR